MSSSAGENRDFLTTRLQAIWDCAPMMMSTIGPDMRVRHTNAFFNEFIGVSPGQSIEGRIGNVLGCVNSVNIPCLCGEGLRCPDCQLRAAIEHTILTGQSRKDVEYRGQLQREGARRDIVLMGSTVLLADIDPPEVLLCAHDVTEQQRLLDSLRESERRFLSLFERSYDAIFLTRPDGTILDANPAACQMFGRTKEEICRLGRSGIVDSEDRRLADALAKRTLRKAVRTQLTCLRSTGERFEADVAFTLFYGTDGQLMSIVTIRDLAERVEMERQLKNSRDSLRALTARLESHREGESKRLSRQIHDELGQHLTGLKMDLRWIEREIGKKMTSDRRALLLNRVADSLSLTDETIAVVQRIAAELRPSVLDKLGLGPAIEFECRRLRERIGIACEAHVDDLLPEIPAARATALYRILQEGLTNVARHSGATRVTVELFPAAGELIMEIRDNGRGITDEDIESLLSLGLIGMRERAEQVGGETSFRRNPGGGTAVTVRLPVSGQGPEA